MTASSVPTPRSEKLGFVEKFGFGLGDLASNLLFQTFNMFLLFFYTDVVGLSSMSVFWIFAAAKIWDMVNDPLMGAIADRTHTRWGRYRPYIFALAIPYGISAWLLFSVPEMSDTAKVFYCGATYIFATMVYTGINIPYCALMGVLTPDVKERTRVSQYRFFLAFFGGWLISTFTEPLVRLFGDNPDSPTYNAERGYDPVVGYPATMTAFGILAVVLFFITFFTTKERVQPETTKNSAFKDDWKDLMSNGPWLILFISAALNLANVAVKSGSMMYFLNYTVSDSARVLFTIPFGFFDLDITRVSLFMSTGAAAAVLGTLPVQLYLRFFEKRTLYVLLMVIQGVLGIALYFIPDTNYNLLLGIMILGSFFGSPGPVVVFSMYADVADYSEWKNHRRAMGLIIATILFAIKGGLWLGSQLLAGALWFIGYSKETASDASVMHGIEILFTWVPGLLAFAAGLVVLKYTINDAMLEKIQGDLQARKAANS